MRTGIDTMLVSYNDDDLVTMEIGLIVVNATSQSEAVNTMIFHLKKLQKNLLKDEENAIYDLAD